MTSICSVCSTRSAEREKGGPRRVRNVCFKLPNRSRLLGTSYYTPQRPRVLTVG